MLPRSSFTTCTKRVCPSLITSCMVLRWNSLRAIKSLRCISKLYFPDSALSKSSSSSSRSVSSSSSISSPKPLASAKVFTVFLRSRGRRVAFLRCFVLPSGAFSDSTFSASVSVSVGISDSLFSCSAGTGFSTASSASIGAILSFSSAGVVSSAPREIVCSKYSSFSGITS